MDEDRTLKRPAIKKDNVHSEPRRLLLLHNFTSLFVSKTVGVVVGWSSSQLLLGLLFLALFQETRHFTTPEIIHLDNLRLLTPLYQLAAYVGIWSLLLAIAGGLAVFLTNRIHVAADALLNSMAKEAVLRYEQGDEDNVDQGFELLLSLEDQSLLNQLRLDLRESIEEKVNADIHHGEARGYGEEQSNETVNLDPEIRRPDAKRASGSLSTNRGRTIFLKEEPRLVMNCFFLRYIACQVLLSSTTLLPVWVMPDIVVSTSIFLFHTVKQSNLSDTLLDWIPMFQAALAFILSTIVVLLLNRWHMKRKQPRPNEGDDHNGVGRNSERLLRFGTDEHLSSALQQTEESQQLIGSPTTPTPDSLPPIRNSSPEKNPSKDFLDFSSDNINFSLGIGVGVTLDLLVDSIFATHSEARIFWKIFNAIFISIVVTLLQWKVFDTSSDPPVTTDLLIILKRFVSVSLFFFAGWSIRDMFIDVKEYLFAADTDLLAKGEKLVEGVLESGLHPVKTFHSAFTNDSSHIGHLTDYEEGSLRPMFNLLAAPIYAVKGNLGFLYLPVWKEFTTAVVISILLTFVIGLLTIWEHSAKRRLKEFEFRRQLIKLIMFAFGNIMGWCWATFVSAAYERTLVQWTPSDKPWLAAVALVAFVLVVIQIACAFSMIIVYLDEKAKEKVKWKQKYLRRNRTLE